MQKSEQINELAKALCAAQLEMKHAVKDAKNPFFKSDYATLAAISDACLPALNKNGIAVIQTTGIEMHRPPDTGTTTFLQTTLVHTSGQWIAATYPIHPVKNDPQSLGSALSYARRYCLAGITGVVVGDDDGEEAMSRDAAEKVKETAAKVQVTRPSETQLEQLKNAIIKSHWSTNDVKNYLDRMGLKTTKELNWFQFINMLEKVEKFSKPSMPADEVSIKQRT